MHSINAGARKANLFIVGAPKCGTTAWMEYLRGHPDIFFPDSKEECYFALDLPNFRFIHSEADYSKLFADSGRAKVIGEASAMYLFSEAAAEAIREYNPDARILIFLRGQDEYLPALHNQFLWEFTEKIPDFETAWRLSGRRTPDSLPRRSLEPRTLDYRAMGRFFEQVSRYLDVFPPEQVRVIRFDTWISDPRRTYLEILDFLGVRDDGRTEFPAINKGATYRSRRLAQFLYYPPEFARKAARMVKRVTGLPGSAMTGAAEKAVNLLTSPGYKQISPELRDEIRRYFAEDNRLLEKRLQRAFTSPSPKRSGGHARTSLGD